MTSRFQSLRDTYFQYYNHFPHVITVAPGRVNLIGEHVDHQDFPVLPVNIKQSTQIAIGISSACESLYPGVLEIRHMNPKRFSPVKFNTYSTIHFEDTSSPGSWVNGVVAAYLGLLEYYSSNCDISKVGSSLLFNNCFLTDDLVTTAERIYANSICHILVDGDLPLAAGLSSSSSLLVGSAMAFLYTLRNIHMSKDPISPSTVDKQPFNFTMLSRYQLAQLAIQCEHYLGVFGGGMDQASILLGLPEKASFIEFKPLKIDYIPLVQGGTFMICDTCTESCKTKTAPECYNKRIFELKIAAYLMMRSLMDETTFNSSKFTMLLSLNLKSVYAMVENASFENVISLACNSIPQEQLTKVQLEKMVGHEVIEFLLQHCVGKSVWEMNNTFEPLKRALHVYNEAGRVYKFASICKNTTMNKDERLSLLGKLMNESQSSLSNLYECSTSEIDYMVSLAKEFGAYGSRLTGAGWGGSVVSLIRDDDVHAFIAHMKKYYEAKFENEVDFPKQFNKLVFEVKPIGTATVLNGITFKEFQWN